MWPRGLRIRHEESTHLPIRWWRGKGPASPLSHIQSKYSHMTNKNLFGAIKEQLDGLRRKPVACQSWRATSSVQRDDAPPEKVCPAATYQKPVVLQVGAAGSPREGSRQHKTMDNRMPTTEGRRMTWGKHVYLSGIRIMRDIYFYSFHYLQYYNWAT